MSEFENKKNDSRYEARKKLWYELVDLMRKVAEQYPDLFPGPQATSKVRYSSEVLDDVLGMIDEDIDPSPQEISEARSYLESLLKIK